MVPLSVDLMILPDPPATTKVLFPNVTSLRLFAIPEVLEVQVVSSDEEKILPPFTHRHEGVVSESDSIQI